MTQKSARLLLYIGMITILIGGTFPLPASALSCVETGQYLDMIIGNDTTYVVTATVDDTIFERDYTAEVVTIKTAHQGYVEKQAFLYHQKDETWGYLCNNGPIGDGKTAIYVLTRNESGQYAVNQTLTTESELAKDLLKKLTDKNVVGEVVEFNATDRQNQIFTRIMDLFKEMLVLLKEKSYWEKH